MNIEVNAHDPRPDQVSVRGHEVNGVPRKVVEVAGIRFYGDRDELAAVFASVMRELLGYDEHAIVEVRGQVQGHQRKWGLPGQPTPVTFEERYGLAKPEPLAGDHTFLGGPSIHIEAADETPGRRVMRLVDQNGKTVGEIHDDGKRLAGNISMGDESEVFEQGHWRPARPGEVVPTMVLPEGSSEGLRQAMADLEASVNEAKAARVRQELDDA